MNPADDLAHRSDDPAYSDTWYVCAVDPVGRRAAMAHVAWRPALGSGVHTVGVCDADPDGGPGRLATEVLRADTTEPFESDLLSVIVDPWRAFHVRSDALAVDLTWTAFHSPVDFGAFLDLGPSFRQSHLEAGGRAHGFVAGGAFSGAGHRDRSYGPRDMGVLGRHVWVVLAGVERDVSLSLAMTRPVGAPADAPPAATLGYGIVDGANPERIGDGSVERALDATPVALHAGSHTVAVTDTFGSLRLPGPPLPGGATYRDDQTFFAGVSATLGPVVGLYEDGTLVTF